MKNKLLVTAVVGTLVFGGSDLVRERTQKDVMSVITSEKQIKRSNEKVRILDFVINHAQAWVLEDMRAASKRMKKRTAESEKRTAESEKRTAENKAEIIIIKEIKKNVEYIKTNLLVEWYIDSKTKEEWYKAIQYIEDNIDILTWKEKRNLKRLMRLAKKRIN